MRQRIRPPRVHNARASRRWSIVFAGALTGWCGVAAGEDLWDIYQRARQADAQYHAAEYTYRRAQLLTPLAKSARRPEITVQGRAGETRLESADGTYNDAERDNQINLTARMPIYNRALNRAVRQARLRTRAAAVALTQARAELIVRVAERYFAVLAAQDNKKVAQKQRIAIDRQTNFAREWLAAGIGTQADVFDAQARQAQAVAEELQAENRIANAQQALKQIIGAPAPTLTELDTAAALKITAPDALPAWIDTSLRHNFALQRARLNAQIAAEEIKRQRAARLPTLGLTASQQRRDVSDDTIINETTASAHATVTWNLLRGGGIYYQTKQAGFAYNAALQTQTHTQRQAEADTTAAYLAVTSGINQVQAFAEAVRAGEASLRAKQEGFRAGLTTNLEVLNAQRDLSQSQSDYFAARYALIVATLRLEQAAGKLDEGDLRRVNAWLAGEAKAN